jgi:TolB protein
VLRRLTATPAPEQAAAWSPDGSKILFTRSGLDSPWLADVFVVNADGTGERRLTHAAGDDVAAAWSPDGRRVAFTSRRSGSDQIFVMNADGSDQRNLSQTASTTRPPAGSEPQGRRHASRYASRRRRVLLVGPQ